MPHDVFLSHSSKDKTTADAACAVLESRGIRCWIAPRDILPGEDWSEAILEAISAAGALVLIFSSQANESQQVKREVERAVNRGIAIIPFRIEDVLPTKSLEYFLSTPHWLDAFSPPLEQHLNYLADTIEHLLKRPGTAAPRRPAPVVRRSQWMGNPRLLAAVFLFSLALLGVLWWAGGSGPQDLTGAWRLTSSSQTPQQAFSNGFVLPSVRMAAFSNPETVVRMSVGTDGAYQFEMSGQDEGTYRAVSRAQNSSGWFGRLEFQSRATPGQIDEVEVILTRLTSSIPQLNAQKGDFTLAMSAGAVGQTSWIRKGGASLTFTGRFENPICFVDPGLPWLCALEFLEGERYRARFSRILKGLFEADGATYRVTFAGWPPQEGRFEFLSRDRIKLISPLGTTEWARE